MLRQLVHLLFVLLKDAQGLLVLVPDQFHNLFVDQRLGLRRAGQGCVAAQILVGQGLHSDHVELVAHAVSGDHRAGEPRGLLDVVGSARRNAAELHFLRCAAAAERRDLVLHLLLAHQIVVALFLHLHGVSERAGCAGNDGDLLDRCAVGLHSRHQCVPDLVIGYDQFLLIGQNSVLLLVTRYYNFNTLLKIRLIGESSAVAHSAKRSFVDDIGQLRAGCAGRHSRDLVEVHVLPVFDLLGVYFQDILSALEIRQFHGHPAVEAAGPCQRGIQCFGPVRGRQDHDAYILFKAVHLREQLVQGLLALVIAAQGGPISLLADSIDLIDKYDTGCLLLGLPEQIADLGGAHTYEHLHEFRAGHGEEGHVGLAGDRLGQHGFAGSGRAHEQDALGHGCADLLVLAGIVQILHDLLQVFLGLLFARHVRESDALRGLDVDLGVALSHAEHHGIGAAGLLHHPLVEEVSQTREDRDGKYPGQEEGQKRRHGLYDIAAEFHIVLVKAVCQIQIRHRRRREDLALAVRKQNLGRGDLHLLHLVIFCHGDKCIVVCLRDLGAPQRRHHQTVEQDHDDHDQEHICDPLFFGLFDFVHSLLLSGIDNRLYYHFA